MIKHTVSKLCIILGAKINIGQLLDRSRRGFCKRHYLPLCQLASPSKVDPEQGCDTVNNQKLERFLGHLGSKSEEKTKLVLVCVSSSVDDLRRQRFLTS